MKRKKVHSWMVEFCSNKRGKCCTSPVLPKSYFCFHLTIFHFYLFANYIITLNGIYYQLKTKHSCLNSKQVEKKTFVSWYYLEIPSIFMIILNIYLFQYQFIENFKNYYNLVLLFRRLVLIKDFDIHWN